MIIEKVKLSKDERKMTYKCMSCTGWPQNCKETAAEGDIQILPCLVVQPKYRSRNKKLPVGT
jgi:hypothetical protein